MPVMSTAMGCPTLSSERPEKLGSLCLQRPKTGSLIFTIPSPAAEKLPSFGYAVAGGKDVNNDGKPDFVIGAPLLKNSQGGVFIFNGSDGTLIRRLRIPTSQKSARAGASVAAIDDVTGDGRPDIHGWRS